MKEQTVYDRIRNRTKPETRQYVHKNLALVAEVSRIMKEKGWSQKDLAKKMGKTESEISKWLSGLHNLTLKSITKMEVVLEATLLEVPQSAPMQSSAIQYITFVVEKAIENRQEEISEKAVHADFAPSTNHSAPMAA
jgi:transcriptional regulator with XRE-family HTH domain